MITDRLIVFTKEDGKRSIVNADYIVGVDEIEKKKCHILTSINYGVVVEITLDQVLATLAKIDQQQVSAKRGNGSLYDRVMAQQKALNNRPDTIQNTVSKQD